MKGNVHDGWPKHFEFVSVCGGYMKKVHLTQRVEVLEASFGWVFG